MTSDKLNIATILLKFAFILESLVFIMVEFGETVLGTDDDFLSSWELELSSSESFDGIGNVLFLESDGVEDLVDLNSGDFTSGFTEGTSHTGLKSICTSA